MPWLLHRALRCNTSCETTAVVGHACTATRATCVRRLANARSPETQASAAAQHTLQHSAALQRWDGLAVDLAGKSTLMSALFRLLEAADGSISIDAAEAGDRSIAQVSTRRTPE